jgi:signal transduction histidine kinase
LAHEIRNPLAAVTSALELLDQVGSQNDESVFARSSIRRQLDFMQRLVEDLLEITRIGMGKVQLQKQLLPLNEVILAAVETCRPAIDDRTHDFEVVMPGKEIMVEADPARLQQVFVNLIHNAVKYTEYGGQIWVKVSVEGQDAVVKVEDTGIGISPEMLPQIFNLFTQSEFGGSQKSSGLGIGLSVVQDLVSLHGGTVQVRSDGIGKGSEFTVRLPLKGPDAGRPDRPSIATGS